jgi:hypothetical protein
MKSATGRRKGKGHKRGKSLDDEGEGEDEVLVDSDDVQDWQDADDYTDWTDPEEDGEAGHGIEVRRIGGSSRPSRHRLDKLLTLRHIK